MSAEMRSGLTSIASIRRAGYAGPGATVQPLAGKSGRTMSRSVPVARPGEGMHEVPDRRQVTEDHRGRVVVVTRFGDSSWATSPHVREFGRGPDRRAEAGLADLGEWAAPGSTRRPGLWCRRLAPNWREVVRQRRHACPRGQAAAVVDLDEVHPPGRERPRVLVVVVPELARAGDWQVLVPRSPCRGRIAGRAREPDRRARRSRAGTSRAVSRELPVAADRCAAIHPLSSRLTQLYPAAASPELTSSSRLPDNKGLGDAHGPELVPGVVSHDRPRRRPFTCRDGARHRVHA